MTSAAGLAVIALLTTACSASDDGDSDSAGGGGKITLHVGTFGTFGFDKKGADLYTAYEKTHPNIKIVEDNVQDGQKYWDTLKLRMSRNSGLADIQAIEVGYIAEATGPTMASKWVDLSKAKGADTSAFVDYKTKQATVPGSDQVIGLGTDIGPMAICYRKDYFKQAGLASEPDAVAKLWQGDWAKFLDVGAQFKKKAPKGVSFTDSASGLFNAVLSAQPQQYSDANGKLVYDTSPGVKKAWDLAVKAAEGGYTAKLRQFDEKGTWNAAIKNGKFATVACPAWMTGIIKDNAPKDKGKWAIALPPQNGNWGGSFLGVPKSGKHVKEATELATYLTAAAQQEKVFGVNGNTPSNKAALTATESAKIAYFGDTPAGKIYSTIAQGITPAPIGANDGQVKTFLTDNGILDIEQRGTAPKKAWDNVTKLVNDKIEQ
ncbi:extracellular solute-binding protein [Streptomyces sp. VRA16 Mangrove soil]|uniref:ABC transporter substrate-binding protein n=1 Tax=Streptomyces sp. VRA16 Mangrove soil TaxID=2817434 RepID=UPI0027DB08D3|nr:extracellular solute-binding protein [Streptomyces sp. VRA16 Mangrove soil]